MLPTSRAQQAGHASSAPGLFSINNEITCSIYFAAFMAQPPVAAAHHHSLIARRLAPSDTFS
jgi:hypothetical protein